MIELSTFTTDELALCSRLATYAASTKDVRIHDRMRATGVLPSAVLSTFFRGNKILKSLTPYAASERIQHITQGLMDNGILVRLTGAEVLAAIGTDYSASSVFYWIRSLDKLEPKHPAVATPLVVQFAPMGTPVFATKRVEINGQQFEVDMDEHGRSVAGSLRLVLPQSA